MTDVDEDKQDITKEIEELERIFDREQLSQRHPSREKITQRLRMMMEPKQKVDLERLLDILDAMPTNQWRVRIHQDQYQQRNYYRFIFPFGACVDVEVKDPYIGILEVYSKPVQNFPNEEESRRYCILKYPSPSVDSLYGFGHLEVEPGFYYRENEEITGRIKGLALRLKREIENENKKRVHNAKQAFLDDYHEWRAEREKKRQ